MDDVCVVSGIGCSGRFSSYINCNTVHSTHARPSPSPPTTITFLFGFAIFIPVA
jgi:hypothetical protein